MDGAIVNPKTAKATANETRGKREIGIQKGLKDAWKTIKKANEDVANWTKKKKKNLENVTRTCESDR